jgi:hypothetical protein
VSLFDDWEVTRVGSLKQFIELNICAHLAVAGFALKIVAS